MKNLARNFCVAFYLLLIPIVSVAIEEMPGQPSKPPTVEQMRAVAMPSYHPGPNQLQECLGRLSWSSEKMQEWAVRYEYFSKFSHSFSENVFSRGSEINFGNVRIGVYEYNGEIKKSIIDSLPENIIIKLSRDLPVLKNKLDEAGKKKNSGSNAENSYDIAESDFFHAKENLEKLKKKYYPYVPGISDSYGFGTLVENSSIGAEYSVLRAYLFRSEHLYMFESRERLGAQFSSDDHARKFSSLLKNFRTRRMNEIPTELGVCIPFGFLPDDGRTVTDIKQSIRWKDAPGVLYTIHTGNVQPRQLKSTVITALASSQVGRFGTDEEAEVKKHVDQRIGPRQAKIGGLVGEQGGVALKVTQPGSKPYEAYSVFTGYSGWLGSAVLPFILVDMQSFTMEQAPELKANPPPFRQSMERLEGVLKYMRLRPTNPPMPELVSGK
ncbi:T6SS immunity protein Tli4 family protein [Duganella sp. Leaf126]|uniref:T6SS immunity protein Tli4 family protein n=1 Tax=Duganella sp. Leaf126 TaxID=1736266 RepID=UPI0012E13A2D|nr:T6SS immunity protein Tli4 family protein [Duganella sp. Leaf126]